VLSGAVGMGSWGLSGWFLRVPPASLGGWGAGDTPHLPRKCPWQLDRGHRALAPRIGCGQAPTRRQGPRRPANCLSATLCLHHELGACGSHIGTCAPTHRSFDLWYISQRSVTVSHSWQNLPQQRAPETGPPDEARRCECFGRGGGGGV
jgi:hypothetical protein